MKIQQKAPILDDVITEYARQCADGESDLDKNFEAASIEFLLQTEVKQQ